MKKKITLILGIILVIFIGIALVKNTAIKSAVTVGATAVTGAPVQIDGLSFGVFKPSIKIKGFKMYNPKGFPEGVLVDIPRMEVDYSLSALFRKKLHLRRVYVDIKEMGVLKNQEGKLNVDGLKIAQKEETKPNKPSQQLALQIDELTLSIGRVVYKDYSQKNKAPAIDVFEIGIKEKKYKNITSAQQLAALIIAEPLKHTAIKGAAIYTAAAVLGAGLLPVGVAATLIGKDSAEEVFEVPFEKAYTVSLQMLKEIGKVQRENKTKGEIKAKVEGLDITLKIESKEKNTSKIIITARQFLLPKPEKAGGILYRIADKLR